MNIKTIVSWVMCLSMTATLNAQSYWSRNEAWYENPSATPDEERADLFYVASTNVNTSHDTTGRHSYRAQLTSKEREMLQKEMTYVQKNMADSFNYYSPYYHQFTMEAAMTLRGASLDSLIKASERECCEAFDYYMSHSNNGRSFVLAGFSQGAICVLAILKHLTPEQLQRCKGVYLMGYRLNHDDLLDDNVKPATGELTGNAISFNTVVTPSGIWPTIADGAATCINPLNWRTDTTAITIANAVLVGKKYIHYDTTDWHYLGEAVAEQADDSIYVKVQLDPERQVLIAHSDRLPAKFVLAEPICEALQIEAYKNLHIMDLLFYMPALRRNAIRRCYGNRE